MPAASFAAFTVGLVVLIERLSSHIEAEIDDVAVLDDILLAFEPELAAGI